MLKDPKEGGACWKCRAPAAPEDHFCRSCGRNLVSFPWYYHHWGIILLTLFALGPFSLVLVWRSPVISRAAQWVYTVLVLVLTYQFAVGCYHLYQVVESAWSAVMKGTLPPGLGVP